MALLVRPAGTPRRSGARSAGRPLASDGDQRRRLILRAAREQFARSGYSGTTNREIASQAGITTGAIYHYFDSKLALYLAVFEECDGVIFDRYRSVLDQPIESFAQRIEILLQASTNLNAEDQTLAAFIALAAFEAHRDADLLPTYLEHDRRITRFFQDLVTTAIANGELPNNSDRLQLVDALRVLTLGLTWCSVNMHDPEAHRRVTMSTVRLLRGDLLPLDGQVCLETSLT